MIQPRGRPAKQDPTAEEWAILDALAAQGKGLRAQAAQLTRLRGGNTLEPGVNRRRGVSHAWLRTRIRARNKTPTVMKMLGPSQNGPAEQKSGELDERRTEYQTDAAGRGT